MNKLSKEKLIPFTFDVDKTDLVAARAAFFNPNNEQVTMLEIFDQLWETANGSRANFIDRENSKVYQSLKSLAEKLSKAQTFNEKYLGHMLSESAVPALLAYFMALRVGSNTVAREVSEIESELEPEVISWMTDLIGYPKEASGTFTSGGSVANTTALWVAREVAVEEVGEDFLGEYVVLINKFAHYSIDKSLRILKGPNANKINAVKIPSKNLSIDVNELKGMIEHINVSNSIYEKKIITLESKREITDTDKLEIIKLKKLLIKIMAVVSIAGETETGIVDPINKISKVTGKHNLYHHVDAAYGLGYMLSSKKRLFKGISSANSVTFDSHKTLYTPYSAGAVLFRDPKQHGKVNFSSEDASYVFKEGEVSLGQKRIEGSMGAGPILSTLAVIQSLSTQEFKALFDHTLNNIDFMYTRLKRSKVLAPVHKPDLNVICFTIKTRICRSLGIKSNKELNKLIENSRKILNDEFGFFFSATNLPVDNSVKTLEKSSLQQPVFRAVLMHPRTEREHIDKAISLLEEIVIKSMKE